MTGYTVSAAAFSKTTKNYTNSEVAAKDFDEAIDKFNFLGEAIPDVMEDCIYAVMLWENGEDSNTMLASFGTGMTEPEWY